jgi:hypothetical protein
MMAGTGDMAELEPVSVWLDYGDAGRAKKFLPNLSAIAAAGEHLWTASDEMRTVECLAPHRTGYRLRQQFSLDELFRGLPGAEDGREADIEALDVADGRLWVCGSHSLTRRSQEKSKSERVDAHIRKRPSRRLFGALPISKDGAAITGPGRALPYGKTGSLRAVLGAKPYIAPFADLPSKENGLDIEGLTLFRKKVYVGMRGPVVDNIAMVAELRITTGFAIDQASVFLHFVDLDGLGARDLTRWKDGILIIAGPVSGADGPFALLHWRPRRTDTIQKPVRLTDLPSGVDHPEAACVVTRHNTEGLLVLCDTSNSKRLKGTQYRAEWFAL